MNEVEEVEYERPNDVSTETDFQEEQEEQEEEDIMGAKKDRDGEAEEETGKGAEEVEGKLEEEREGEAGVKKEKGRRWIAALVVGVAFFYLLSNLIFFETGFVS